MHSIGLTTVTAAFIAAEIFQIDRPGYILWPAMIAMLPMAVLLWLHRRTRSLFFAASFLAVGAVCTYWYIVTFYSQSPPIVASDAFSVDLPMIALVMVGGPGIGLTMRFWWCAIGFVSAEVAANAALAVTGNPLELHATTAIVFGLTTLILLLTWLGRRRIRRLQPLLHRAARDEQLATMRFTMESRAAALMHDTVLSHLAAIANSTDDRLSPQLAAQIARDLEVLIGEEWLGDEQPGGDDGAPEWRNTGVYSAIQEAQQLGLEVDSTGDLTSLSRLAPAASEALGLAVKQCLVNVIRHSGVMRAEVVVFGTDDEISVMVIDAGRGFSEAETGSDRLGLRTSVRRRMESVGGAVRVWSTPGRGTSIVIRVPAAIEVAS